MHKKIAFIALCAAAGIIASTSLAIAANNQIFHSGPGSAPATQASIRHATVRHAVTQVTGRLVVGACNHQPCPVKSTPFGFQINGHVDGQCSNGVAGSSVNTFSPPLMSTWTTSKLSSTSGHSISVGGIPLQAAIACPTNSDGSPATSLDFQMTVHYSSRKGWDGTIKGRTDGVTYASFSKADRGGFTLLGGTLSGKITLLGKASHKGPLTVPAGTDAISFVAGASASSAAANSTARRQSCGGSGGLSGNVILIK